LLVRADEAFTAGKSCLRDPARWLLSPDGLDDDVGIGSEKLIDVISEEIWIDRKASLARDVSNKNADELDSHTVAHAQ
jgi:hypothetical protein